MPAPFQFHRGQKMAYVVRVFDHLCLFLCIFFAEEVMFKFQVIVYYFLKVNYLNKKKKNLEPYIRFRVRIPTGARSLSQSPKLQNMIYKTILRSIYFSGTLEPFFFLERKRLDELARTTRLSSNSSNTEVVFGGNTVFKCSFRSFGRKWKENLSEWNIKLSM